MAEAKPLTIGVLGRGEVPAGARPGVVQEDPDTWLWTTDPLKELHQSGDFVILTHEMDTMSTLGVDPDQTIVAFFDGTQSVVARVQTGQKLSDAARLAIVSRLNMDALQTHFFRPISGNARLSVRSQLRSLPDDPIVVAFREGGRLVQPVFHELPFALYDIAFQLRGKSVFFQTRLSPLVYASDYEY